MNLNPIIPTILTFLGGPAGGLAGAGITWLAEKFGASEKTLDGVKSAISGFTPEDTIRLRQIELDFQKFCAENAIKIDLAQIEVNKVEAASVNLFVAGWRPATGWICAAALFYIALFEPLCRFIAMIIFGYTGAFPVVDTTITMQVLFGMLGLAGLRSFDKQKGTS